MRRLGLLVASAAVVIVGSISPGLADGPNPNLIPGQESQDAADASDWFMSQRLAPNGAIDPNAFEAAVNQSSLLAPVGGAWTERTNLSGADGNDFSDPPAFIDPTSNFSNSGAGDRWVGGRMTSLAAAPNGDLYAGAADGGVWKSTNGGSSWTPVFDAQGTLSVGSLLVTGSASAYTVYAGTGEANTSSDSYAGIGVLASTDRGAHWTRVGKSELNGALIFRLTQNGTTLLAATSHGLYSFDTSSSIQWTAVLQPAGTPTNLHVGNMVTDVAVRPGTGGSQVVAVTGWRGGAPTNGLWLSTDGGSHFTFLGSPSGWPLPQDEGRTTLAYSATGDRLYGVVQSPFLLNVGTNGKTLLAGAFASDNGDPNGPWTQIAQSEQLANSGSAQNFKRIGTKHFGPGIQAWYNQFLAVDPADKDHVYLGLEEVYESLNGGGKWNTIGRYWNFGFSCFSYSPFEGTCDHNQSHPDQHAAMITNGKLFVGNDGGVYSRALTDHIQGDWTNNNQHIDALQYYAATGSKDHIIYGGLQDNGSAKVFNTAATIKDDQLHDVKVSSVQVFGGDGGYTLVDPNNSNNVITEYVGLTVLRSNDGGANWHFIIPADPNPRFIAPINLDRTNASHLVAGGAIVWSSDSGVGGTTSWQKIFDVRGALGADVVRQNAQVTALDAVTVNGVEYVAAAWCGPCNASFATGGGFRSGIVFLNNSGGTWHSTAQACSGKVAPCNAFPKRYVSGVKIDTANPGHAYLSLSGYSRKWMIGPEDPGTGHVWETSNGGTVWTDRSGTQLPDFPADDIVFNNGKLIVATDIGVYVSSDNGVTWNRLGTNLPNVVVDQLTLDPNGVLVAATHGRGVWTIAAP